MKYLLIVLMLFGWLNAQSLNNHEGDHSVGFWIKGTATYRTEKYVCGSLSCGWQVVTGNGFNGIARADIWIQSVSDDTSINGKYNFHEWMLSMFYQGDGGRCSTWVNVGQFYDSAYTYLGFLTAKKAICNIDTTTPPFVYGISPSIASKIKDVRLWYIAVKSQYGSFDTAWINIYTKKTLYNATTKTYNDMTGFVWYENLGVTMTAPYPDQSNCRDYLPNPAKGYSASVINPITLHRSITNSPRNYNVMLNGKVLSKKEYLNKWNKISAKRFNLTF